MSRMRFSRICAVLSLALLSVTLTGCEVFSSPQNTFAPAGTVAEGQKNDFLIAMWPALAIMILVLGGLLFISIKYRRKKGDPGLPKQVHGNTALELSWTILPALLLAVIAVPTLAGIRDLGRDPADDALSVKVTGIQWAWQFEYPNLVDANGAPLQTFTDLYVPVGREIGFKISSNDVNHSFWVPKLAGKIDAIQGRTNIMWFRADKPGTYAGQCAEFCGLSHADMRMTVIALPQDEFDAWVTEQGATERPPGSDDAPTPENEATPPGNPTPEDGAAPDGETTPDTAADGEQAAADGE